MRAIITIAAVAAIGCAPPITATAAPPRDCGDLVVTQAQPGSGLSGAGVYDVISFSRDAHLAPPACRTAMAWSRAYLAGRDVPRGFKVKAIRGTVGRAFLRIGNEDVGFRVVLRK